MSLNSQLRSDEFLKISAQFKLGSLVTESSHPVTANLSETARRDIAAALKLLFDVDDDVVRTFREFVSSGRAIAIRDAVLKSLNQGGRIFFTGCGSTGRLSILLDSVWRDFWRSRAKRTAEFENRTFSVMAGGDFALIKAVEGFEDFTAFGRKQIHDLGVNGNDVVFAITEGGETSFVIGTAWEGVEVGAKVYFVYNNPDEVLCQTVERSRLVIKDARIEKINLTTGPMAITGSTRMQATSIQLCVMLTVLEMVVRELLEMESATVPESFLAHLTTMHTQLKSPEFLGQLAKLVALEESVYRSGHKNNYFANRFGIDVLTDTTERSPTYCTPPFRKFDDTTATESWAFLFLPCAETPEAWRHIIKREPRCVEWSREDVQDLVPAEKLARTMETIAKISKHELMRFKIGVDGMAARPLGAGDCSVAVVGCGESAWYGGLGPGTAVGFIFFGPREANIGLMKSMERFACRPGYQDSPYAIGGTHQDMPRSIANQGPSLGIPVHMLEIINKLWRTQKQLTQKMGREPSPEELAEEMQMPVARIQALLKMAQQTLSLDAPVGDGDDVSVGDFVEDKPGENPSAVTGDAFIPVFVSVPETGFLLDGVTRVAVKLVMNALSTCTMVRLGRVMGNYMIWVVPSNLKLIDRATRYIVKLTGREYESANQLLFEIIEYVEPRMKSDQAYPPVVGMAVLRAREGLSNADAEKKLMASPG